jgi:hypothetical protein
MIDSAGAVEGAMTIHQALLHARHGRQTWLQVAHVTTPSSRAILGKGRRSDVLKRIGPVSRLQVH